MIDCLQIGHIARPFGTKGEVVAETGNDLISELDPEFVFLIINNIPVPFRLEDWREKTDDSYILKLGGVDNEEQAARLRGTTLGINRDDIPDDVEAPADSLIGYHILTPDGHTVGTIEDIDTSTVNTLLLLENGAVLPFHEDFLVALHEEEKELVLNLPEGLFN